MVSYILFNASWLCGEKVVKFVIQSYQIRKNMLLNSKVNYKKLCHVDIHISPYVGHTHGVDVSNSVKTLTLTDGRMDLENVKRLWIINFRV